MVTPREKPEWLTPQELYQRFTDDARDESWAYPMELGINQYVSAHGPDIGAEFEFVECKGRYCTVAGVVYGGGQTQVNRFIGDLTQSGWWQGDSGNSTVGFSNENEYRFVTIFSRDKKDYKRDDRSGQSIDHGKNST